jgi:ubiquinone/menaquinone biosynthesis C-methylase UbiE
LPLVCDIRDFDKKKIAASSLTIESVTLVMVGSPRHVHSGLSSRDFLERGKILGAVHLRKGDNILDIGCGEGQFALAASRLTGDSGTVYAIDLHEPSIDILKDTIKSEGITNISAFVADAKKHIPAGDNTIDTCLMVNVFHGFAANGESHGVMREISRVVKRRGVIVVVDFKKTDTSAGPPVSIRLAPHEAAGLLKQYGFIAEKPFDVGPYSYYLRCIRV